MGAHNSVTCNMQQATSDTVNITQQAYVTAYAMVIHNDFQQKYTLSTLVDKTAAANWLHHFTNLLKHH